MEELLKAIVLGVVQGLTEFLPVSSSGHLEMGKVLLDLDADPEESLMLTVVMHAATALSTVVVFRRDVWKIARGVLAFRWNEETRFTAWIVLSMIPAAFVGIVFNDPIEQLFNGNLLLVGSMLLVTGGLLVLADRQWDTQRQVGPLQALVIGVAQAIAILPGISRSGATISTSLLLGVDRTRAARFSFLMVVPLIMGKMVMDVAEGDFRGTDVDLLPLLAGFVAAFVTGLLACKWMIRLVKNCQLWWFAAYCFVVGAIAIGSVALNGA